MEKTMGEFLFLLPASLDCSNSNSQFNC